MKVINQLKEEKGQVRFKVIGLILWSALMLFAGNLFNSYSNTDVEFSVIQSAHAAAIKDVDKKTTRLDNEQLAGRNLGDFAPYEPEKGDLVARGHETYYSKDGDFGVGIWESKAGKSVYKNLGYDELMYVLEGSFVIIDQQGNSETFTAGEGVVLPQGWSGTFVVPEGGVRKIWSAYMGGKKGVDDKKTK